MKNLPADAAPAAPETPSPRRRNGRSSADTPLDLAALVTALNALRRGDFSARLPAYWTGVAGKVADTFNDVVELNERMARELGRLRQAVGREGRIRQRGSLGDVSGAWAESIGLVNELIADLVQPTSEMARVIGAVAQGDLSQTMAMDIEGRPLEGEFLRTASTVNTMVEQLSSFASEVTRVAREVGTEGKLGGQADVRGVAGTWKDLTDSVNSMAGNLTAQVRNIAVVTTAVAMGDLSRKITVDVRGEILELKNTINTMVDQLSSFASEVTRVAREVGTEGKLGGQADVRGVAGTWKDLTDNVNFMASNLTGQVRGIAKVVTAVANGDLKRKLLVEAKGEIAELSDTINSMIDTLATFADQVTTVAREVGTEGKLGGQSNVPGAAGTWLALNDNVNQLAATLTTQLRAISDVATAVTKGDLTRSITVEARGEVAQLKDTINEMIRNLRDTTSKNAEQDWLKTNLAKFTRMLQGQRDLMTVGRMILSELAPVVTAQQGVFYLVQNGNSSGGAAGSNENDARIKLLASYAFRERKHVASEFRPGEGLVGQAVLEKERILLTNVPGDYVTISSGLGEAPPVNIIVLPVVFEGQVKAVIELSSFQRFSPSHQAFLDQLTESIGIVLNTIEANGLTEDLLKQSQSLTNELQNRQRELQSTNLELEEKARQLVDQNAEVERKNSEVENKNREVEQARQALEEKASQLSLTSKYKSEFLANMSHELRTPLNSLLILADQLARNPDGNLSGRQVEFAKTIHGSGKDLLHLINDILDLSKIESGTTTVDVRAVPLREIRTSMERTFRHVAQDRGLDFAIELVAGSPNFVQTDGTRLEQVLKNLLANAFKFTERGKVTLEVGLATGGWNDSHAGLHRAAAAGGVLAFRVSDTGIGIPLDKQALIFEAFQQADGSTSRRYGGTGLGLAISREIARLLGGDIQLSSRPGEGSQFTLFLPAIAEPDAPPVPPAGWRREAAPARLALPIPAPVPAPTLAAPSAEPVGDDRADLQSGDRIVLVIEDDLNFAPFLCEMARAHGFKCVLAANGHDALRLTRELHPAAITLDLSLPDLDGWRVLSSLKDDLATRHLPVWVISVIDDPVRAARLGAAGFLTKPASREQIEGAFVALRATVEAAERRLLVVEDDETQRASIATLIGEEGGVRVVTVPSGEEALAALDREKFDCVVVDLLLPGGMSGTALVEEIRHRPDGAQLPLIIYTGKELEPGEEASLNRLAQELIFKDVRSPERLFDATALHLHRDPAALREDQRETIRRLHHPDAVLAGKAVLLVDDDIRNIFAMTSLLERAQMRVIAAESGPEALEKLAAHPEAEAVLMDIMMPGMDGYETTRAVRARPGGAALPIIALTAKAMKGDREKCLEAGCSDYIAKPVDPDQLLALLRTWLHR